MCSYQARVVLKQFNIYLKMGSPADLTLEVRPSTTTASSAFKSVFLGGDQLERMRRLEEYLKALEDERRKIEAFKRELPFCMQLLNDAIEASKEQLADFQPYLPRSRQDQVSCNFAEDSNLQSSSGRPMLEEFIPLKMKRDDLTKVDIVDDRQERRVQGNANVERANLMGLVQSWSPHSEIDEHGQAKASYMEKKNEQKESLQCDQEQAFSSSSKIFLHSTQRVGGAFLPFSREKRVIQPSPRSGTTNLPDLAFSSGDHEVSPHTGEESLINSARGRSREGIEQQGNEMVTRTNAAVVGVENNSSTAGAQSQRKARRCWSPELHRRFVNALQQLGGSQVATPKLIRELMKVEGLTNDEVKSHLQKYRLHTRRPSPAPQTSSPHAPQLVVLGGIWVPPEYAAHAAAAAQQSPAIYNHAQQPHLCQPSLPQDFYSQLNSSTQLQLHPSIYYDQQQAAAAHSQSSPQGPLQLAGQTSNGAHVSGDVGREESVGEDGKSGSSSWKGEDQAGRLCEVEDNGDQRSYDGSEPVNVRLSQHSSDEDDPEFEDSRASEATLHF